MHELSLIANLLHQVLMLARAERAKQVLSITVRIGALSHLSIDHLREHFTQATLGTLAEGAQLNVAVLTDLADPHAQEIMLESLEIATD